MFIQNQNMAWTEEDVNETRVPEPHSISENPKSLARVFAVSDVLDL